LRIIQLFLVESNKNPGSDDVTREMIKYGGEKCSACSTESLCCGSLSRSKSKPRFFYSSESKKILSNKVTQVKVMK